MDGYLLSAFIGLVILYALVWMRGMVDVYQMLPIEGFYDEAAVAEYKQKVMLMFAKYGKGLPIAIDKMDGDLVTEMFKDFLIIFNEFQAKTNGKPVGQADVQSVFPLDFLNEYNANMATR
jgi:hypothetical protein